MSLVNSVNPDRLAGQKTAAFEVVEALGDAPDFHFVPVGNAGNTPHTGSVQRGLVAGEPPLPRMFGFQAAGTAPIVRGHVIKDPDTIATAIRIGNPASWELRSRRRTRQGVLRGDLGRPQIL